jgi:hypothetical protein
MSETKWILATGRSRSAITLALTGMAVIVMTLVLAAPDAVADTGCPDGDACFWPETNYNGFRGERDCAAGGDHGHGFDIGGEKHSAKNRCSAQRAMALYWSDGVTIGTPKACLDHNENRPDPGRFNFVVVGEVGSHC